MARKGMPRTARKKGTLFGKPRGEVIKHPGSETRRAEKNGRSLHEQAEIDAKSPDKRIRGKGQFALRAQAHKIGKKPSRKAAGARRTSKKRTTRKRGY